MKKLIAIILFYILFKLNYSFSGELKEPNWSNSLNENIIKFSWKESGTFKVQNGIQVQKLKKGDWKLYCAITIEDTICWLP